MGAGPVGLLTAIGLARANAGVIVPEADGRPDDSPRAMTCIDPTLDLLNRLGILDDAERVGNRNRHINFVWPQDDRVITIDTLKAGPHRIYPHNLRFGQEALGQIAMDAFLKQPNTSVRFGHRVRAISQGERHATVTVEKPDGTTEDMRASFVVGADGGSSTMRKLLGLELEGFARPARFVATNLYHDFTARGWANVHMIGSGPERASWPGSTRRRAASGA